MAKAKILIIDDNPDIIELLTARLEANDYEITSTQYGKDALEKTKKEMPDLILLDISMPDMDGFTVGNLLRSDTLTKKIPIIMSTALTDQAKVIKAVTELEVMEYLQKPYNPDILLAKVASVLARAKSG